MANWQLSEVLTRSDLSRLKEFTNSKLYKSAPKSMNIGLDHHIKTLT